MSVTTARNGVSTDPAAEIQRVARLHERAFTRAEVEEAEVALRDFQARHPDYRVYSELSHRWPYTLQGLREREQQARDLGLSAPEEAERESLFKSILWHGPEDGDAYDEDRLRANGDRLRAWLERFPADPSAQSFLSVVRGDLDVVALLKEAAPPGPEEPSPETRELVPA